jgi:hypothetical protein
MRPYRRLIAPISVTLLILVAALVFINQRPAYVGPPPILDPKFGLWVGDQGGAMKLMLWDLTYVKAPSDNVSLRETAINGRSAIQLSILQSGSEPVYVYLTQTIDGARLAGLLADDIGVWVLAEPCNCNGPPTTNSVVFGLEVNDGIHTLTFIFSDRTIESMTVLAHRYVYLPTQTGTWTYQHINVTREYTLAQWSLPQSITFSLFFDVGANATGWHYAYVNSFNIAPAPLQDGVQAISQASMIAFSSSKSQSVSFNQLRLSQSVAKV